MTGANGIASCASGWPCSCGGSRTKAANRTPLPAWLRTLATVALVCGVGGLGAQANAANQPETKLPMGPPPKPVAARLSEQPVLTADPTGGIWHGGPLGGAKAAVETLYVYGGPGCLEGKFQTSLHAGLPDTQGWMGVDLTQQPAGHWHASTFNAANLVAPADPGNHGMWCGELLASCGPEDPPEGYANLYDDNLDWYGTVPDAGVATTVRVEAVLNHDAEVDYDWLELQVERASQWQRILVFTGDNRDGNGDFVPVVVDETFTVDVADYVGPSADQVHLRWRGFSDGAFSDEDCGWPSAGLAVLDNVRVSFDGVEQTWDGFEPGDPVHWLLAPGAHVGDFSKVWPLLADLDPCHENATPQWAFIDDGLVVPGTGGTLGITWTYGPGGYVVNLSGGLLGGGNQLRNEIWSPPIAWPAGSCDGARYEFDLYRHLPQLQGLLVTWHVRASTDGGTSWGPWRDRNYYYYGNTAEYVRMRQEVTDLLPAGRTHVQLAFGAHEIGWSWEAPDPTPAPYFDNVAFTVWDLGGPAMAAADVDLLQDGFPASGALDLGNPGGNSVRLDMARNISPKLHLRNDPGDSLVASATAARAGSVLLGPPQLHYLLRRNPLFDPYRTSGWPDAGTVLADSARARPGGPAVAGRWAWDLPDTGFLFPGDELHYYLLAHDQRGAEVGVTALPADLTGFASFPGDGDYDPLRWPGVFTVKALPSVQDLDSGAQPTMLFWNDASGRGGDEEWFGALRWLGIQPGVDCDVYETNGPTSGVGNGLGGRATAAQLAGYRTLLYTCGDLGSYNLGNGDFNADPSQDIGLLSAWLSSGGKRWLGTGDDLEDDLRLSGTAAVAFRDTWLAVAHGSGNLRSLIGNQTAPLVVPFAGNAVGLTQSFVAYGGCEGINDFDAVTATGTAVSIAEFTSPAGAGGAYPYAAAVLNSVVPGAGLPASQVVYLPYDFSFIHDRQGAAKADAGKDLADTPARVRVLQEVLTFFGEGVGTTPTAVPPSTGGLTVRAFPNPFNPRVTIALDLPVPGEVAVRLYDVRGACVRTLLAGPRPAGRHELTWDGTDTAGRPSASGVYFVSARSAGVERLSKVMLVR